MTQGAISINDAMKLAREYQLAGRIDEADAIYTQILQAVPAHHDAWHMSALIAQKRGQHALALEKIRRSLALKPTLGAQVNLGIMLGETGHLEAAADAFRDALKTKPDDVRAWVRLAVALRELRRYEEAAEALEHALQIDPGTFDVQAQYAKILQILGRNELAVEHFRRALAIVPEHPSALNNLGMCLLNLGRHPEARAAFERAFVLDPRAFHMHSNLLFAMTFDPACTPEEYLAAAKRYGESVTAAAKPFTDWPAAASNETPQRLRIGFVSGDLRVHPVGFFLENFIAKLDQKRLELFAYTTNHEHDELSDRLRPYFAATHNITALNDEAAAKKIRADGIHVLIDLAGHTAHNRLPVFAWKPAPVQISWLGFSASTGVPAIDWLLVDDASAPGNSQDLCPQDLYSEKLWYLPGTRVCFSPPPDSEAPPVSPLPAQTRGVTTFGTFQNMTKPGDNVLRLWSRILDRVPGSRLRVQNSGMKTEQGREKFLERATRCGIATDRIDLVGSMPRADYFAAHAEVDIILDTFPYPGGTTTCEALWMGVPTLTYAGRTLLSRYGASVLTAVGLTDWIADSEEDYVNRAVAFAGNPAMLAELRAALRERVRTSALCDAAQFARHFEDALHGMWRAGPA